MTYQEAINLLKEIHKEMNLIKNISGLLSYDSWTGTPRDGKEHMSKLSGYMAKNLAELFKSEEADKVAEFFSKKENQPTDEIEIALLRQFMNEYNTSSNVTAQQKLERVVLLAASRDAWVKAKEESDYAIFKPHFKKSFEHCLEMYKATYPDMDTFKGILQNFSEGLSLEEINAEFAKLQKGISELNEKILASNVNIRTDFLEKKYDKEQLKNFVKKTLFEFGFDENKTAFGIAPHPFTSRVGPRDARMTLNYDTFLGAFFAGFHEAGHAMYNYRTNDELVKAGLWGGIGGGFHESQSKFYENMVARGKEFSEYIFPKLKAEFKEFEDVTFDEYYKAINKVQPSFIRTRADEVTYSIHPIIRFELEQELIKGEITIDELPEKWNDKYEEYLGIRPTNDREGILQDMHWGTGLYAYFQTYTLGNIYDGQILHAMMKNDSDIFDDIKKGDFNKLHKWLTDNIHQYGNLYTEGEMIKRVTGEKLNADYFLEYLNKKYGEIYGF